MPVSIKLQGFTEAQNALAKGRTDLVQVFTDALVRAVNLVKDRTQNNAPFKTGTLRRSVHTTIDSSGLRGKVLQNKDEAPYGEAIEFGSKARTIVPVKGKALYWKGALHPMRSVNMPARPARPFFRPAFDQSLPEIKDLFQTARNKIVVLLLRGSV